MPHANPRQLTYILHRCTCTTTLLSAWSDVTWPIRAILGIRDSRYLYGTGRSHNPPLTSSLNALAKAAKSKAKKAQLTEHWQALMPSASRYHVKALHLDMSLQITPQASKRPPPTDAWACREERGKMLGKLRKPRRLIPGGFLRGKTPGQGKKNLLKENLARAWTFCPGYCSGWCF
ncbi:hypothetical protein TrVGV298_011660 [Trichoderma virens]|nr:hypothetical protein TrVGV298_011660 [Trichoderma virens]